jgi:methylated-DNA-[protein]-cysteine S-methyltransferase
MINYEYKSPIGILVITANGDAITEIKYKDKIKPPVDFCENPQGVILMCIEQLDEYFAGTLKDFTVKLCASGTDFRKRCWEELRKIPHGETISYKELAVRIGNPAAIRAVGGANHHNPINILIPCHRVIGADGSLTGYGGGLERKEFLLKHEREK